MHTLCTNCLPNNETENTNNNNSSNDNTSCSQRVYEVIQYGLELARTSTWKQRIVTLIGTLFLMAFIGAFVMQVWQDRPDTKAE
mmetsp:Transcript_16601/g.23052  ORF Transcript_16601/g.23052 Transcript_16601/m.23052 type:complete len:84 (+) Transcript_16601:1261-1512(+)